MSKRCTRCKEEKPISEFHQDSATPDGYKYWCKSCRTETRKFESYMALYGLSKEDYLLLKKEQNNSCALCGRHEDMVKRGLVVDHDHTTGELRGLLCNDCNTSLGKLGDNEVGLTRALRYVKGEL